MKAAGWKSPLVLGALLRFLLALMKELAGWCPCCPVERVYRKLICLNLGCFNVLMYRSELNE